MIINNSHNEGKIEVINATFNYVGGICGNISGSIKINNSFNLGNVINNSQKPGSMVGGLIGEATGIINIKNSYNKNHVENNKDNYFTEYGDYDSTGGLVGRLKVIDISLISTIENSYNSKEGRIDGGKVAGGIIGYIYAMSNLSLINVYNNADIVSSTDILESSTTIGGLAGYLANSSKLRIINSYNTGNVTSAFKLAMVGGILGYIWESELHMVNVYSNCNLTSTNIAGGILSSIGSSLSKVTFNNGYFYGNISAQSANVIPTNNNTINNLYYKNSFPAVPGATTFDENKMRSSELVDILNANIKTINLEEIDELLKGYTLKEWQLGDNNYPTLINE